MPYVKNGGVHVSKQNSDQKKQENKLTEKKTEKTKHEHQQRRPVQTRCDDQVFLFVVFDINVLNTVDPNNHCTGQSFNCNFWLS